MERIVEKLDRYLEQKDFAAAERHLRYWLSEAAAAGDRRGRLALLNEQIGFYRKQEQKTEALAAAETIAALQEQKLTKATCGDLEKHAYSVNDAITDGMIRNLHILTAV